MKLEEIKEALGKDILNEGYHLYDLTYHKKDKTLTCLIDESLDLDQISLLSEKISVFMDKYDQDLDEYLLDVSCVGVERPIKTEEEINNAVGSYIHLETKSVKQDGTLEGYENGFLILSYLEKNRKKSLRIAKEEIKQMRYAVKF